MQIQNAFRNSRNAAWATIVVLLACGQSVSAQVAAAPRHEADSPVTVPFVPVFSGQQGGARVRANLVVRDHREWRRVFNIAVGGLLYKPDLPAVDFDRKMLVAVLLGEQIAVDRGVRILRVSRTGGEISVEYEATQGATRDSTGMAIVSTTQPFFFVSIDRSDLPVRFVDSSPMTVKNQSNDVAVNAVRSSDPTGRTTGGLDDIATAQRGVGQDDRGHIVSGSATGLRLLADATGQNRVATNVAWLILCALFVLVAHTGVSLVATGLGEDKNQSYQALVGFLTPLLAFGAYWVSGWALMFGGGPTYPSLGGVGPICAAGGQLEGPLGSIMGTRGFFLAGDMYDVGVGALFFQQAAVAALALSIPLAVLGPRLKTSALVLFGLVMGGFIYPLGGHWSWGGGWLGQMGQTSRLSLGCGFVDLAGGGVVFLAGGMATLAALLVMGPARKTRVRMASSQDLPQAFGGTALLGMGWVGYLAGATHGIAGDGGLRAGLIPATTWIAACGGVLAASLWSKQLRGSVRPESLCTGFLAGLISVSASAAFVSPSVAFACGSLGALFASIFQEYLNRRGLGDPLGILACLCAGGAWSVLSVGIFADGSFGSGWNSTFINRQPVPLVGILYGGSSQLIAQVLGACALGLWSFAAMAVALWLSQSILGGLCVGLEEEKLGRDSGTLRLGGTSLTCSPVTGSPVAGTRTAATSGRSPQVAIVRHKVAEGAVPEPAARVTRADQPTVQPAGQAAGQATGKWNGRTS